MYAPFMQAKSLQIFDRQIQRIQAKLAKLGPMRPGTLSRQYRQPKCQQGAYYQLSYTYQMRSHTEYVPKREVVMVRKEIAVYQRYKKNRPLDRSGPAALSVADAIDAVRLPIQSGPRGFQVESWASRARKPWKNPFSHRPLN
jgi:hypothetical protein